MKNDIYDLLNDIDNQIDTFETVDITSTDLKNWKQSFALKKKTSVKKHTWKKYAAAAAAFIILLGGSSAPVRQNVYAQSQQIMESLSTLLGFMIGLFNLIPFFGAIVAVAIDRKSVV